MSARPGAEVVRGARRWGIHTRMRTSNNSARPSGGWDRRSFLAATLGAAAAAPLAAQTPTARPPASPVPAARDWARPEPVQYPDPDVVALDPRFQRYIVGNT